MKTVKYVLVIALMLGANIINDLTFAQEFSIITDSEIAGQDAGLGIAFSVKKMDHDRYTVTYRFNNKMVTIRISYAAGNRAATLRGIDMQTGDITVITSGESELLAAFLDKFLNEFTGQRKLEMLFIRTLNLLASWPSPKPLIMEFGMNRMEDIPTPESPGIEDICGKVNQLHEGEYPIWGIWTPFAPREVGPYPWDLADCLGRCGKGCVGDGPPNNDIYIFSQDCFNHDVCVGDRGTFDLGCLIAFDETFDDFLFGASCQKDNLDIIINGQDDPVAMGINDVLDITVTVKNVPPSLTIRGYYYIYAETASGTYWYHLTSGWLQDDSPIPYIYYSLVNIQDYPIYADLLPPDFPTGLSTFYFTFVPDTGPISGQFEDALEVIITHDPLTGIQPETK
jgi:hypothetical protein